MNTQQTQYTALSFMYAYERNASLVVPRSQIARMITIGKKRQSRILYSIKVGENEIYDKDTFVKCGKSLFLKKCNKDFDKNTLKNKTQAKDKIACINYFIINMLKIEEEYWKRKNIELQSECPYIEINMRKYLSDRYGIKYRILVDNIYNQIDGIFEIVESKVDEQENNIVIEHSVIREIVDKSKKKRSVKVIKNNN